LYWEIKPVRMTVRTRELFDFVPLRKRFGLMAIIIILTLVWQTLMERCSRWEYETEICRGLGSKAYDRPREDREKVRGRDGKGQELL